MTYTKPELREVGLAEDVVLFLGAGDPDNISTEDQQL